MLRKTILIASSIVIKSLNTTQLFNVITHCFFALRASTMKIQYQVQKLLLDYRSLAMDPDERSDID